MRVRLFFQANILQIAPAMAAQLVKSPDRSRFNLTSVRYIQTAAAPLGVGVEGQLRELFKLKYLAQGTDKVHPFPAFWSGLSLIVCLLFFTKVNKL